MKQDGVNGPNDQESRLGGSMSRRAFVGLAAAGLAGLAARPAEGAGGFAPEPGQITASSGIRTNIDEILKIPRTASSMPGRYPGIVAMVNSGRMASSGKIDAGLAKQALDQGLMKLTGKRTAQDAWREFVSPSDQVGIKINPIGHLPTSRELTQAVIDGLQESGVPRSRIAVWDRRLPQLLEGGFTPKRFPDIELLGTEILGPNGEYTDDKGEYWGNKNLDFEALSYFADIEGSEAPSSLPAGADARRRSYFSKLVTRRFTKIINLPVLKSVQPVGISFALKNLTFGTVSNASRLHQLIANAIPEVCAFPCLRDKVVLHIGDALVASYYGGVGAPRKHQWDANRLFIGSDGVAVDLLAQKFLATERIARGVQSEVNPSARQYLDIAAKLGLGVADISKIDLRELTI